jgi:glycosyltransferase involved in cell wall biosynthesis
MNDAQRGKGGKQNAVILVPNWSGGIDRLFEDINRTGDAAESSFRITTFHTHGRSLRGLSVLPFRVVYYSSATFYTLFLPIRLLKFCFLCLFRKIDVCHVNLSTGASTIRKSLFAGICRLFNVTYVIHLHGGDYRRFYAHLPRLLQYMVRLLYGKAGRVIVLGQLWKDYVVEEMGVHPDNVEILPNSVRGPASLIGSDRAEPPQILFLGRLIENKGIVELIDALSTERVRRLPWTTTLAGDGEVAKYRSRVESLDLSERVTLPGWLSSDAVDQELAKSSIFVLPSHHENLPLSMLEAMAYGLCVIVTPVGSVEDVVTAGHNGVIVPVGDSVRLAEALASLLENAEEMRRLGENARADFLRLYDFRDYRSKLEQVYRDAIVSAA